MLNVSPQAGLAASAAGQLLTQVRHLLLQLLDSSQVSFHGSFQLLLQALGLLHGARHAILHLLPHLQITGGVQQCIPG